MKRFIVSSLMILLLSNLTGCMGMMGMGHTMDKEKAHDKAKDNASTDDGTEKDSESGYHNH
ncbi:MAG: hypothetical protein SFH39_18425 [Candidatus Magnetobacterium sp. LHC-1]|nr:hypothetical protein [Nitrospirota bacterium]